MYLYQIKNGWVRLPNSEEYDFITSDFERMLPCIPATQKMMLVAQKFKKEKAPSFEYTTPCTDIKGKNLCWDGDHEEWEYADAPVFIKIGDEYQRLSEKHKGLVPTKRMVEKAREMAELFYHFRKIIEV